MYYLKYFLLFSLLGFIMESVVYKVSGTNCHSGVFQGPYTLVYGIGGVLTLIVNNYFEKVALNSIFKLIILYIIFALICTAVEYLIGNLIHLFFDIDKWNYTNHKYHFGKYICLDLALIWGILPLLIMKLLVPFFDKVMPLITNNTTILITFIMIIDIIYTFITKSAK